jgi:hypothetical protein
VKVKLAARGVVAAQHAMAETGDRVWRKEDGSVDQCVTGSMVARQCPRLDRWPCTARSGLLLGDDVGEAWPWQKATGEHSWA